MKTFTPRRVSIYLRYEPETGKFVRKDTGERAGFVMPIGYRSVGVLGRTVYEHRLAWFVCSGVWPSGQIDPINGDRSDNRIDNLRDVSPAQNMQNTSSRDGTSQFRGVSWDETNQKWRTKLKYKGKTIHVGRYYSEESAARAFNAKALSLWGSFARLNAA